jgi:hypothetical protein
MLGLSAGSLAPAAFATFQVAAAPAPALVTGLQQTGGNPPAPSNQMRVTVDENAAASVLELGVVFAARKDIHASDGLQLSILGNTNPGLVKTDLSGADLTLTYVRGKNGAATITVGATDIDGVSARETILVMVRPGQPAATPLPATVPAPLRAI